MKSKIARGNLFCDLQVSAKNSELTLPWECSSKTKAKRTIWSFTPSKLTEMTKEMASMKKDSGEFAKKLSYAEFSFAKFARSGKMNNNTTIQEILRTVNRPVL